MLKKKPIEKLRLRIEGEPFPWVAPTMRIKTRSGMVLGKPQTFSRHHKRKKEMQSQIQKQLPSDWQLLEGPVGLQICHYFRLPESRRKEGLEHGDYKVQRPDFSNCDKLVEDVLTGLVYLDDSQVVVRPGNDTKQFGDPPRTEIIVYEV